MRLASNQLLELTEEFRRGNQVVLVEAEGDLVPRDPNQGIYIEKASLKQRLLLLDRLGKYVGQANPHVEEDIWMALDRVAQLYPGETAFVLGYTRWPDTNTVTDVKVYRV